MQVPSTLETNTYTTTSSKLSSTTIVDDSDGHVHNFEEYGPTVNTGGFGHVCKVKCVSCLSYFARKDILLKPTSDIYWRNKQLNFMDNELEILQSFQHPYVIDYIDHVRVHEKELRIFTEFCEFGDLGTRTKEPLTEEFVWHVCEALSSALSKCHYGLEAAKSKTAGAEYYGFKTPWTPIIHRDIKPENVFLTRAHENYSPGYNPKIDGKWNKYFVVKLGDFGTACKLQEDIARSTLIGTRQFLAPELLEAANPDNITKWSTSSDIWSVGATLYRLLTRELPEEISKMTRMTDRLTAIKDRMAQRSAPVSELLSKLISECLDPDPHKRPSSLDLLSVSFKAQTSDEAMQRSTSFWRTMASHSKLTAGGIVAKTTQNFLSGYLSLIQATFSSSEICVLLSLQALGHPRPMLSSAGRLMKTRSGEDSVATVFHVVASATSKDPFLKKLCWETSKWPHNPSLCQLSLKKNHHGFLPSMVAAWDQDEEVAKQLLEIEQKARKEESQRLIDEAVDRCRKISVAQSEEELEFMYNFLTNNSSRSRIMKEPGTFLALSIAAAKGYMTVLRKLIDEGADVSATGDHKETALHFAASAGQTQVIALLLEKGHSLVDRRDDEKRTPLHCATRSGHETTAQLLLDKGASINARDAGGRTALYGAASRGHLAIVQLLLNRGANPTIGAGISDETPQKVAERKGHEAILRLLLIQINQKGLAHKDLARKDFVQRPFAEEDASQNTPSRSCLSST